MEESTKHVNVEGKREALLASSAAAEEATKVSAVAANETGDLHSAFERVTPEWLWMRFLTDEASI